jgi:hypothetical protein
VIPPFPSCHALAPLSSRYAALDKARLALISLSKFLGPALLAEVGKGQRLPNELELELARTRKELAEVKMERDLLKKFATYFAKESR